MQSEWSSEGEIVCYVVSLVVCALQMHSLTDWKVTCRVGDKHHMGSVEAYSTFIKDCHKHCRGALKDAYSAALKATCLLSVYKSHGATCLNHRSSIITPEASHLKHHTSSIKSKMEKKSKLRRMAATVGTLYVAVRESTWPECSACGHVLNRFLRCQNKNRIFYGTTSGA